MSADLDLSQSIIPKSDQINYEDLANGTTATYTIRTVTNGNAEQPFNFMLVETDKAYRPSKTMRKVIVAAWGPDATAYAGRRLTLYGEPSILFGGKKVGGLRIRAMSHIDGRLEVMAQTTRGKRETFVVQPLPPLALNAPDAPTSAESNPVRHHEEGEPAFGASTHQTTEGGATSEPAASESEAPAPQESLRAAINRTIREIQDEGGGAWLSTWAASVPVKASSAAIAEHFGEAARDLRVLMGQEVPS